MTHGQHKRARRLAAATLLTLAAAGCQATKPDLLALGPAPKVVAVPGAPDRDCLTRAMYFEAQRSDDDGLLAVGTVVMNRLDSPNYPETICGVVGQKRQFADGVLTKPMRPSERAQVEKVADAILAGKRHAGVRSALHFHVAGRTYRYPNMHYLVATGGNRFYEKTDRDGNRPGPLPRAVVKTEAGLVPIQVATAAPEDGAP
ncbi:cell wall hydrolase [Enterovirga sp.]|jgi:spore germination cell wall hydrolase CwlJ-like protein|uniref:cell wall hydrolase n=1 Tax=Enterovirga sp. TaxID=2026350 RepID=UPI0026053B80|nr:cell wall hydrolase [Enterovirga sp.]MDB5592665.1 cell wall hydrolase SleB [Enterovirga sp.]